jgi:hypothetical protein
MPFGSATTWFPGVIRRLYFLFLVLGSFAEDSKALDLVGYLPYYRINASYNSGTLPTQLARLNEIRYFGLTAASDGSIVPLAGSGTLQSHSAWAVPSI